MRKITLVSLLLSFFPALSQVTIISPTGDGGFETGATFEDNGWSVANPAGTNRKWYPGTGQSGYTGQRCAFIGNNETTVGAANANRKVHLYRSVTIPSGAEDITLTFNYKQETSDVVGTTFYDYIAVYTSNTVPANNALPSGGALQFGPYPSTDAIGFQPQSVTLPNSLAGTTTNLIFTFVADDVAPKGYGAVDDISLTYILPSCAVPSNLIANNTTSTSTDLSWTAAVGNPSGGYQYYYTDGIDVPDASTVPSGTAAAIGVTVPGLEGNTDYKIWVRSDCGSGSYSSWFGPVSILTLCTPENIPFTMGFEDTEDVDCIKIENINGSATWTLYTNGGNGSASGTNSARYKKNANNPADDWFFIKGLDLSGGQAYTLTFKYKSTAGPALTENLEVKYGTLPSSAAMTLGTIATLEGIATDAAEPFLESSASFTPATTGTYYIGFHCYSIADQGTLYVDDVKIETMLSTSDFNATALQYFPNPVKNILHVSYAKNISGIEIYNLMGQKIHEQEFNAPSTEIDLSGLPAGNYVVKVKSDGTFKMLKIIKH